MKITEILGERARQVWQDGNAEEAMLTIGQSVGRINDIPSAAELVDRMVREAESALQGGLAAFSE